MNRSTWKGWERHFATALGGVRVPVTGRQRGSAPDVEHERFAIEVKAGAVISTRMRTAMQQAEAAGQGTGKMPLVCIAHHEKGKRDTDQLVLLRLADFQRLLGIDEA